MKIKLQCGNQVLFLHTDAWKNMFSTWVEDHNVRTNVYISRRLSYRRAVVVSGRKTSGLYHLVLTSIMGLQVIMKITCPRTKVGDN